MQPRPLALQLAFEDTGTGSPVVILHGLFGSSANWRAVARALAPHHRVLCVDLRNHGNSPWADAMDYLQMAEDVRVLSRPDEFLACVRHALYGSLPTVFADPVH